MNQKEKDFVNEKGEVETVVFEAESDSPLNMHSDEKYVLASELRPKVKSRKRPSILTDVGPKSEGFAGVFTLGALIAIGAIIIGLIIFKY